MFLGFNAADYGVAKTALGLPSCVRLFPTPANFDKTVDIASRIDDLREIIESYNSQGVSVFLSEKPKPVDVIDGSLDAYYIALGFLFKELGDKYGLAHYYTAWHEPENDIKTVKHPGNPIDSPEQFSEMIDHIHAVIHRVATTGYVEVGPVYMAYQWETATQSEYKVTNPAAWIPAKRDFIGADVYSDLYHKLKTQLSQHTGWLRILASISEDDPVYVVERGIKDHAQQLSSLVADFQYLATVDNPVIGLLYWYNTGEAGDWKLVPEAAAMFKDYNYLLES